MQCFTLVQALRLMLVLIVLVLENTNLELIQLFPEPWEYTVQLIFPYPPLRLLIFPRTTPLGDPVPLPQVCCGQTWRVEVKQNWPSQPLPGGVWPANKLSQGLNKKIIKIKKKESDHSNNLACQKMHTQNILHNNTANNNIILKYKRNIVFLLNPSISRNVCGCVPRCNFCWRGIDTFSLKGSFFKSPNLPQLHHQTYWDFQSS